jgi:hypothetical protein
MSSEGSPLPNALDLIAFAAARGSFFMSMIPLCAARRKARTASGSSSANSVATIAPIPSSGTPLSTTRSVLSLCLACASRIGTSFVRKASTTSTSPPMKTLFAAAGSRRRTLTFDGSTSLRLRNVWSMRSIDSPCLTPIVRPSRSLGEVSGLSGRETSTDALAGSHVATVSSGRPALVTASVTPLTALMMKTPSPPRLATLSKTAPLPSSKVTFTPSSAK